MNLRTRIKLAKVARAKARRAQREAEVEKMYRLGYRPAPARSHIWEAAEVAMSFIGCVGVLSAAMWWVLQ